MKNPFRRRKSPPAPDGLTVAQQALKEVRELRATVQRGETIRQGIADEIRARRIYQEFIRAKEDALLAAYPAKVDAPTSGTANSVITETRWTLEGSGGASEAAR